jgi:adenylate kinase family enzyme
MRRICIVGIPGAGKSTLAREVGRVTGLPVIHLDQHYFEPNWKARPTEEWSVIETQLLAGDAWIIDGAFATESALPLADLVVWLDLSRPRSMWRALRRNLRHRRTPPPDFAPGCEERLDRQFFQLLRYIWRYPRARALAATLEQLDATRVVRLRSPRATRRWLASLAQLDGPLALASGVHAPGSTTS